jgi:replicative DNA helicase
MSSYNERLRSVARDLGVNYNYLISSEYNEETGTYNQITDEEYEMVVQAMKYYERRDILFFDVPGDIDAIEYTCQFHARRLIKEHGKKIRFIINIDHTLLVEAKPRQEAIDLMADIGKLAIRLRKTLLAMVNLLGQLNNKIEDTNRLLRPELHYPQKSDIFAAGQVFNACDNVFVIHQPMLLKLNTYGTRNLNTDKLIHLIRLKARHGNVGSLWFENRLHEGKIVEIDLSVKKANELPMPNQEGSVNL